MDRILTRRSLPLAGLVIAVGLSAALPAMASDAVRGKAVFASQCSMCHSPAKGGPTILGPDLFGVVGRPAASIKGFNYSKAMKATGYTWSEAQLRTYLPAPMSVVAGTHMTYAGLKNPGQLDDLIAYLASLK